MGNTKVKVIGISAVSGGGKTTIINELIRVIPKSKALYFDEYDFEEPKNIIKWVEDGANYNQWKLTPMIEEVETVINDKSLGIDYLFLDYPFASKHDEMSKYIDYTIFIDTPLDIAYARRVIRDYSSLSIDEIVNEAKYYITKGRMGYEEMLKSIKPNSDCIVDGNLDLNSIIATIKNAIGANI